MCNKYYIRQNYECNEKGSISCSLRTACLAGGTGSLSESMNQPDFLPDAQESGTPNVPGIAGLAAGIRFVRSVGAANIAAHERKLVRELARALEANERLEVFSHSSQTGVLSVRVKGVPAEQAAAQLADAGIAVRAGLHCAPLAHRTAGTEETGTVRLSFSFYSPRRRSCRCCSSGSTRATSPAARTRTAMGLAFISSHAAADRSDPKFRRHRFDGTGLSDAVWLYDRKVRLRCSNDPVSHGNVLSAVSDQYSVTVFWKKKHRGIVVMQQCFFFCVIFLLSVGYR